MKIINNKWKTFYVNESNFLLKTDKAFFIQIPTANNELAGVWLGLKMAKYNETTKSGKQVYCFSINKELNYKIFRYKYDEKGEVEIIKEQMAEKTGAQLIDAIFATYKK